MVAENSEPPAGGIPQANERRAARTRRKVSDDILHAFHFACDTKDFEIADRLLRVLENLLVARVAEPAANRARELAPFIAAHERLWTLRHPPSD